MEEAEIWGNIYKTRAFWADSKTRTEKIPQVQQEQAFYQTEERMWENKWTMQTVMFVCLFTLGGRGES